MDAEQEQKLKAIAEQEYRMRQSGAVQGDCLQAQSQPVNYCNAQPSLRERIRADRFRAEESATRRDRLLELEYLLDKHPDVARILELLDQVR